MSDYRISITGGRFKLGKYYLEGKLELSNPSSVRRGDPIQVTYSYDENQIMNCKFTESRTGISKQVDLDMSKFSKSKNIDDITAL